jgi:hypothetical protein
MISGTKTNESLKCIADKRVLVGGECSLIPVLYSEDLLGSKLNPESIDFLNTRGVLIRLNYGEFMMPGQWEEIDKSIGLLISNKEMVCILVDIKDLKDEDYSLFIQSMKKMPFSGYSSVYIAVGAFPETFGKIKEVGYSTIERDDYKFWKRNFSPVDRIGYSDYTVQYPHLKSPNPNARATVSISYTGENVFHIYKGHSRNAKVVKDKPFEQYFYHAVKLTQSSHFKGRDYSYGDSFIQDKADQFFKEKLSNTGNFTEWLSASINHHIIQTIDQLEHTYNGK